MTQENDLFIIVLLLMLIHSDKSFNLHETLSCFKHSVVALQVFARLEKPREIHVYYVSQSAVAKGLVICQFLLSSRL